VQVPPIGADGGEKARRHDEVRGGERAVGEKCRAKRVEPQREKGAAPAEEGARPKEDEQAGERADERDDAAALEDAFVGGEAAFEEERVAVAPDVGRGPELAFARRERIAGEQHRQRGEALGQVAVLGLEPVVAERVVGVARGEVRDLVGGYALAGAGGDGEQGVQQREQHGERDEEGRRRLAAGAIHGRASACGGGVG
jgi:hypothetical protein